MLQPMESTVACGLIGHVIPSTSSSVRHLLNLVSTYDVVLTQYCISLIICRTFLHEYSHVKNGVQSRCDFLSGGIFVKLTVRHAYSYTVYTKSHLRMSADLAEGNFQNTMTDSQNWGYDL